MTEREIERKYLVGGPPVDLDQFPRKCIRQGYLAIADDETGTEVRVRQEGRRRVLTVKRGHGETRRESEVEISREQFKALWDLTRGSRVRKVRHALPHEGLTIEVDVYRRKLKGLVTAEVEFPDEETSRRFQPPAWLGKDVTGDDRFQNQNLARHGPPTAIVDEAHQPRV